VLALIIELIIIVYVNAITCYKILLIKFFIFIIKNKYIEILYYLKMDKKSLYESIMRSVAKHVKNALNEYRTAAPEHNINMADLKQFLKMTI